MQIKEINVSRSVCFNIGQQYSNEVLVIHFKGLPDLPNKYIYVKKDNYEKEVPLVGDLYVVSRPLTTYSGEVKAQIIARDPGSAPIALTPNFKMMITPSNYSGIGEDESYPDDPNIKNYFVKIDEKLNSFEELANLVQTKLDNGEFVGAQGPKGEKGDPGEKGEPGDVTEEYRNLASQIAQNASDAQTSATNAQTSATNAQKALDDTKDFVNQAETELNQIKTDTNALKDEANASAVNAKSSETKAKEYANNLQASTDDISQLKEDLGQIDKIVLNEGMTPTETTDYGFVFNTIIGRKYIVKIPKTDGYKVAALYASDAMQQKIANLTDLTDNRIAKDTEFKATRSSYFIRYQAITPNKEYSVKVVSEVGVFEYVNTNTPKINEVLNINFDDFATKEDVNKGDIFSFTKSVSAVKGNTSNIKGLNLRKEMTYSLEVVSDISVYIQLKIVTAFSGNESISYNKGLLLGNAIYVEKGKSVKFENIENNNYVGYSIIANNTDATISIKAISETETAEGFYVHSKNELINDYYSERPTYACLGDSITSNQVTGIGTVVRKKLGLVDSGNYACGYATCSDWHDQDTNTTVQTMDVPQNTNTNDNVLSNQVRRLLQATTNEGETISWTHPIDGEFSIGTSVGVGTGTVKAPNIIYIAIGTNDGNNVQNTFSDDSDVVLAQSYSELTRNSYASALRWAIETLQCAFHNAKIFVASPLQAYSINSWMSLGNTKAKRDCTEKIAKACGVKFIDSFYDSGFSYMIAKSDNGGGVHPSNEWKENIACFIAGQIESNYWTSKRYLAN